MPGNRISNVPLRVITPLWGLEKRVIVASQRCVALDALEQWTRLLKAKINLSLGKSQPWGVTAHMTCPVRDLWLDHL